MSVVWEELEDVDALLDAVLANNDFNNEKNEIDSTHFVDISEDLFNIASPQNTADSIASICSSWPSDPNSPRPLNSQYTRSSASGTFSTTSSLSSSCSASISSKISLCEVCLSREWSGHVSYGGRCCESCRGFFRRVVRSERKMACKKNNDKSCKIDSRNRGSCAACRFAKCLQIGMRPKWVAKKGKNDQRNTNGNVDEETNETNARVPHLLSLNFTLEEQLKLTRLCSLLMATRFEVIGCTMERHPQAGIDFFEAALNNSVSARIKFVRIVEKNELMILERWASQMDELRSLNPVDASALINHNFPLIYGLINAILACDNNIFHAHLSGIKKEVFRRQHLSPSLQLLARLFSLVEPEEHQKRMLVMWYGASEIDDEHRAEMMKVIECLRTSDADLAVDMSLNVLVSLVLLFSTQPRSDKSMNTLINPEQVERVQNHFVLMLHRYLRTHLGLKAGSRVINAVCISHVANNLYRRHCQMIRSAGNPQSQPQEMGEKLIKFIE